ncbi:MAG TPA: two-component regulator propeller domain-containing protein [Planctomycetaceae bacterium]
MLVLVLACSTCTSSIAADEAVLARPEPVTIPPVPAGGGWVRWDGFTKTINGSLAERVNAIAAVGDTVWVGTSAGRLFSRSGDGWTTEAELPVPPGTSRRTQITGIARQADGTVWLSTDDGIRRLAPRDGGWTVTEFRTYYEGHPAFVSGAYLARDDSTRLWGYVDDIYIPRTKDYYAPYAVSREHGLFSWGGYHGVWHHFLPHYWGANSPWLDLTALVARRRPTAMVEDTDGNLWVGTEWDGLIRFNSHARKYAEREPEQNKKDGTEFTVFGADEVGAPGFWAVADLVAASDRGVWAAVAQPDGASSVARFDGERWEVWPAEKADGGVSVVGEAGDGKVYVAGTFRFSNHTGDSPATRLPTEDLIELDWATKSVRKVEGPALVRDVVRLPDGRVFAAAWHGVFEKAAGGK